LEVSLEDGGRCFCSAVSRHKKVFILHNAYQEISKIYVKVSILSLLCLLSLFLPLSGVLVHVCSVVNIQKAMIKCSIARKI
jgi:hypothetical protein